MILHRGLGIGVAAIGADGGRRRNDSSDELTQVLREKRLGLTAAAVGTTRHRRNHEGREEGTKHTKKTKNP